MSGSPAGRFVSVLRAPLSGLRPGPGATSESARRERERVAQLSTLLQCARELAELEFEAAIYLVLRVHVGRLVRHARAELAAFHRDGSFAGRESVHGLIDGMNAYPLAEQRQVASTAQTVLAGSGAAAGGMPPAPEAAHLPVFVDGVVAGVLTVERPGEPLSEAELDLLAQLVHYAGAAIGRARQHAHALRATREWDYLVHALDTPLAIVDADGQIRSANRALAARAGRALEQIEGHHHHDAIPALRTELGCPVCHTLRTAERSVFNAPVGAYRSTLTVTATPSNGAMVTMR